MIPPAIDLSPDQAAALARLARRRAGLSLDRAKLDFFRTRIARLLRETGARDCADLLSAAERSDATAARILDALTTHTTAFFREARHYDWLASEGFARLSRRPLSTGPPFTIWSAACSTGAELWSAGMILLDFAESTGRSLPFALLGTDVSARILKVAEGATYTEDEVAGVPVEMRARRLLRSRSPHPSSGRHVYRISRDLRRVAAFRRANLLESAGEISADVAFLRNVLIYFDPPDRERAVRAVVARLRPGGVLLTGHSETLDARAYGLEPVAPSIFLKATP